MTLSPLANVKSTRELLEEYGLSTKKALGQHFLINDSVVVKICDLAEIGPHDDLIEVGPGIGTLTVALLGLADRVIAVERDKELLPVLGQTCAPWKDKLYLIQEDALKLTRNELPFLPKKFVANLPYAVAATLVLDYFERFESLESATVMVQAEVAQRMAAKIGSKDYGAYSIKLALFANPCGSFSVSENNFFPPPRVKSSVIRLDRVDRGLSLEVKKATMTMADAAFENRRKTISNSMKVFFERRLRDGVEQGCQGSKFNGVSFISDLLENASIDPKRRGEQISLDEYIRLGQAFLSFGASKYLLTK